MSNQVTEKSGGMPLWAKILIGVVVVGVVGVIALVVIGGALLQGFVKQTMDPANAQKVAQEIVDIDALPPGWKYALGTNMGVMKMASVADSSSKTIVNFIEIPNPRHETAEKLTAKGATQKGRYEQTGEGHTSIAGQDMYYTRGIMHTARNDAAMEMGAITGSSDKAVLVQILEEDATSYDDSRAQALLGHIKGFPSVNK